MHDENALARVGALSLRLFLCPRTRYVVGRCGSRLEILGRCS